MIKEIIKNLYKPKKESHKGENGKLLVIGGSKKYSGSPIFSLLAARRFVDLLYFYPGENDHYLIQAVKNIPEVIVLDSLEKVDKVDCVVFGMGMGNAKFDVAPLLNAKKLVIDAEGFNYFEKSALDDRFILTPHSLEFKKYFGVDGTKENVIAFAKKYNCTILKKGPIDIIADKNRYYENKMHNQGMTKGGTGDVLAGLVGALACKNPNFEAAVAGAYLNGFAANVLLKKFGFYFCASDLANELAIAFKLLGEKFD